MDISIVIPTKNAGELFDKVLERVFKQETEYEYEVICVDSGSSDQTLSIIQKYPKKWLQNFIDAKKSDPEIVGGFGIHYPYPDCNVIDKRDLYYHFKNFGEDNTIFQLTDENRERYETEEGYRHLLSFFSDNNSCIRRDIFEKYPYEYVNFAEDQIWAKKMIELGFKKLYCPYAPVYTICRISEYLPAGSSCRFRWRSIFWQMQNISGILI